jgi:peptide/nickel transport system permease protein
VSIAADPTALAAAAVPVEAPARRRRGIPGLRGTGVVGHIAAAVIVIALVFAVIGPWIAPPDTNRADLSRAFFGSAPGHLLGFDSQGRDIVARLLVGARAAIVGPVIVVSLSILLGATLAVVSAWRGGVVDSSIRTVLDILFAFPGILLAVLVSALFGASLTTAALALAVAYTPYIARVIRAASVQERSLPYIATLEIQGQSAWRICLRHLVPNVAPHVLAQATIVFGYAMVDLAAISFIGLGIQAPDTDWGLMVAGGQPGVLQGYATEALAAGICIVVVVVAFNLLGERFAERATERK